MTVFKPTRRELLSMAAAAPALTLPMAARAELSAPEAHRHQRDDVVQTRDRML